MNDSRSFLFLLASSREGGNTEALAREAAAQLPAGTEQRWLRLADLPLPVFEDVRHAPDGGGRELGENERLLLDATLAATDVVIASPLYWYSVSSSAKLYLDYWSHWLRVPGADFKERMGGKTFWAVSALASEDQQVAEPLLGTLRLSAEYFGARWGGGLLGYANRPGQVLADGPALERARDFFASARRPVGASGV
ncbi:NAD(P)H-dependent oxidoreductase [Kitasatospora sp. MAA4]|uniref:flavodoxin family protein n=1 Tax=Kitasatospora sp. MAA4 TaxID=3035093 RepID=UPI002474031E|nr:NAD(P)H-dependent oxidoreductase [Kitasatospora sp. MAA4]